MVWPWKILSIHWCLGCVIRGLQPFSFVSSTFMWKLWSTIPLVLKLMKYICLLVKVVDKNFANILNQNFSLIMYGWDSGHGHYFAMFASCPPNNRVVYWTELLLFWPMENKGNLKYNEHVAFIEFNLCVYKRFISKVSAIWCDNFSLSNQSLENWGLHLSFVCV